MGDVAGVASVMRPLAQAYALRQGPEADGRKLTAIRLFFATPIQEKPDRFGLAPVCFWTVC